MPKGKSWTREDTIIAYALYCVIPFSKVNNSNQTIKDAAQVIGHPYNSLKMRICNFATLDPDFIASGRAGLRGASRLDREIYSEFSEDWPRLSALAEELLGMPVFDLAEPVYNGPEKQKKTFQEISDKQARRFFRKAVMTAYEGRCCISGMAIPQLLIASHIKPYAVSDKRTERANPANGLCLNAFYDRAFDQGIMTVLPNLTIRISSQVKELYSDKATQDWLYGVEGRKITRPARFAPRKEFLEFHNEYIFLR